MYIVLLFGMRLFAQRAAPFVPAADAPPPPAEARVFAADDTGADSSSDDPSDLDDDDDDDDDVMLPARIVPLLPTAVAVRFSWRVRALADTDTREPLFRPPRAA